ncbi:MAG: pilus assembly protein, partial [SAR86 cluster bacterium]
MSLKLQIRFFLSWMVSVYLVAASTTIQAAELALSDSPLFLGTQIDPNIFFMLDDSGSMDWETLTSNYQYYENYWESTENRAVISTGYFYGYSASGDCTGRASYYYIFDIAFNTDNVYSGRCELEGSPEVAVRDWRIRNSTLNIMYYNPAATYSPWTGFSDANFSAVRSNPQPGSDGYNDVRNLSGFIYDVWIDNLGYDNDDSGVIGRPRGPNSVVDGANGIVDLWDSHITYTINNSEIEVEALTTTFAGVDGSPDCNFSDATDTPQYSDCFGTLRATSSLNGSDEDPYGRTLAEAKQNVANWYEFHRRRSFVMKAAVARVMNVNTSFRFGLSLLNDYNELFREVPAVNVLDEDFPAHNAAIIQAMYAYEWGSNGTPLRRGLERVGRYYSNYYSSSYADPIISACQQNYSVLFTDGYWGGSSPYTSAIGDEDGDGAYDTLADVAHYFYNTDLSPLPNDVPTSPADQNEEQHMVSFTVAFGVTGNLEDTDDDGLPNPELEENGNWNNGSVNTNAEKIDDLWHAAFNSKAVFVSAQTTEGVATAIAQALLEIADRVGSAASVATNTGSLNAGSHLFQARFDSSDWKGQLLAFQINLDGSIEGVPDWEAGSQINAQDYSTGREILTYNPDADVIPGGDVEGQGVPFRFPADYTGPDPLAELSSSQIVDLMTNAPYPLATGDVGEISTNQQYGEDLVNYLRGDKVNEGAGQDFRIRGSVLGDIVNSDPKFVSVPTGGYADDLEAKSYNAFITANASRDGVVYVGANEGMLHGFSEATGEEVLAYIPHAVYENLYELTTEDYEHRYFVDGGPNIIDVYMANTNDPDSGTNGVWKTVLAGGLGGGGQGIYALDVTDPTIFDEANAASIVLWEFDDADDADLGYTFSRPQMAKMADGSWAAIFGNGYNNTEADGNVSSTGHAVLYIVDIETGALIKKLDTEAGSVGTPNGLATPLLIDADADSVVDFIYAGDLLGNMWKFDVSDGSPAAWDVAYSSGSPDPLFTTETTQPITSQPQASFHPDNLEGFMIFFGTGQYIEINDNDPTGQATQAFYGIWDKNEVSLTAFDSDDLLD